MSYVLYIPHGDPDQDTSAGIRLSSTPDEPAEPAETAETAEPLADHTWQHLLFFGPALAGINVKSI